MQKTVSFTKNATNVFFHILTRCNLSCRHCYINPNQHGTDTLPLKTIKRWLSAFAPKANHEANLIFLGGEPTLHPDLAAAITTAGQLKYTSITVDTNGYLFNDILHKASSAQLDFFSFSLDGATAEVNDALRGKGSFVRCCDGIKQALAKGFGVSVIFTVSAANLHSLEAMPALLNGLGVKQFFIQVLGLRGKSAQTEDEIGDSSCRQVTREAWLKAVPAAAKAAADLGISTTYPKVYLENDEVFECAGEVAENFFLFPNGRVYRCPLCEDFALHALAFDLKTDQLVARPPVTENDLFKLKIAEGCVMNKLIQPQNIAYTPAGQPTHQIACCMLKQEVTP
jgi:Fe-coproporphyrin III synthase